MANINLEKLKCLLVDDHSTMRKLIKDFLIPMKISSLSYAENGKLAYEKLNYNVKNKLPQYNIVFLDLSMPEVDGYALLNFCRNDRNFDKVAFVIVTGENSQDNIMKVVKSGATSFISKPFTEKDFNEKMLKVIKWLEEKKAI